MVLAAAVVLSLLATALLAASKNWQNAGLGDLSQYYETGNSADPGYVSTVRGDSGGTSYGIYMFASNAGTPLSFVQWLQEFKSGSIYRDMGDLDAAEAQARAALNKKLKGVRNQLKKIEAELDKKRARYDELMELMASEELYADQDKFNAALGEYNGLKQELPKLEDEWLELSTQIEEETARELS